MWSLTFLFLFYELSCNNYVHAKTLQLPENLEDEVIYQKYVEMDKNVKNLVNRGVKMLFPYLMEANEYLNLSSSCKRDAFQLLTGIQNLKLSSLKILDAIGKPRGGIFAGNALMIGDYEECMSSSVFLKDGKVAYKGEYCMIHLRTLLPRRRLFMHDKRKALVEATKNTSEMMQFIISFLPYLYDVPIKFGLCVPSGCSSKDVSMLMNYVNEKANMNATVAYCEQQDNYHVAPKRKVAVIVLAILGLLVLIGSSLDYYSTRKGIAFENTIIKVLMCFSIITNFPKVISTNNSEKTMSSLFGIRSLSTFYVILLHEYYAQGKFQLQGHLLFYKEIIPQFFTQIVMNGFLVVDVFFFLGGFLNVHWRLKAHESNPGKRISSLQIVVHRLWRIYPAYLFSMGLAYVLSNARGPSTTFAEREFWEKCDTKWWQNLLFINNFFHQDDTCLFHSWYIAVDMQLFLISLFTVPVLLRYAKKGIILHCAILIVGLISSIMWAWHKDIMPSNLAYEVDRSNTEKLWNAYATTMPHIAPYFTGMIFGYMIFSRKDFKIPLFYQFIGWPIAALCLISMLFITKIWNAGAEYTRMESVFYFTFSRLVFVLAVAWLVVCCMKGYGGIFNYILSLKIWIPISRISYMMYLVSFLLQMFYFASLKIEIDNSRMTHIWRYMGTLAISGLMALAATTIVESPFIAMEKIIFQRKLSTKEEIRKENNEETQERNITIIEIALGNNLKNELSRNNLSYESKLFG